MKALCVVAHPDDCIIFAWPFIEQHPKFDWSIVYMTYQECDDRAQEVKTFWNKRDIPVEFLGHTDDYRDMEAGTLSFDEGSALLSIMDRCSKSDIILTHSQDGDYGHIHHKFVHECVVTVNKPKLFFATVQEANFECERKAQIDLAEIPLHAEVVSGFQDCDVGRYNISTDVMQYINERLN